MKSKDLIAKINRAFSLATPNVRDAVISEVSGQKGKAIIMTNEKTKKHSVMKTVSAFTAAAAVFAFALLSGLFYSNNYTTESTISLDVNPSIEISVSKNEKVLSVDAKNKDGELIIGEMDFSGANLDVTVNALIGSMLKNGYLNDLANSILVSVDSTDAKHGEVLQSNISDMIDAILETAAFNGAVLSQTIEKTDKLSELADEFDITLGKAQLISDIINTNELYTFADLVPLTINELNLLATASDTTLDHIQSSGEASDKSYIGEDMAKEIASEHAGVSISDAVFDVIELDFDDGVMVYEVDFRAGGLEYEYDINATTGAIIGFEHEGNDKAESSPPASGTVSGSDSTDSASLISEERAKEIAFTHAGVAASDVTVLTVNLDRDDGVNVYEIDFHVGSIEYEYDINAKTGTIIKSERESNEDTTPVDSSSASSLIGKDKAKEIVLTHAEVVAADVKGYSCELDSDDGVLKYEIEFEAGSYEYEYDVNARTGAIIKSERERDDDAARASAEKNDTSLTGNTAEPDPVAVAASDPVSDPVPAADTTDPSSTPALIGEDEAKTIALTHASLTDVEVYSYSCKLDRDDGNDIYEIEFRHGEYEYDYEIDAYTGKVLKSERERDDDASASTKAKSVASSATITEEEAKIIALTHASLTDVEVYSYSCRLDRDDGNDVYEIEFCHGKYEYDYEIDAITGKVLKSERERDD